MMQQQLADEQFTSRFWSKVQIPLGIGECWQWIAGQNGDGYGSFQEASYKNSKAHRIAYEMVIGQIPEGKVIDHLCRNRGCVNPYHMEVVTPGENTLRGESFSAVNARKTHCPNGHPLEGDNLWKHDLTLGRRRCKICMLAQIRACKARRKQRGLKNG